MSQDRNTGVIFIITKIQIQKKKKVEIKGPMEKALANINPEKLPRAASVLWWVGSGLSET